MLRLIPLGGFLGAGKTTTMLAAAAELERRGERVAVITNDQGSDLVDTALAAEGLSGVAEVTGGCFCCRFEDLADAITTLRHERDPDTVIIEAVGSCTDLQATVIRPLRRYHGDNLVVAPLTVVVDPMRYQALFPSWAQRSESDLGYLYRRQIEEADLLALNKTDLLGPTEAARLTAQLGEIAGGTPVIAYSARRSDGVDQLVAEWASTQAADNRQIDVDYDRYAAAEAALAWANQVVDIEAATAFAPDELLSSLLDHIARSCQTADYDVGHLKAALRTDGALTKASVTGLGGQSAVDAISPGAPQRRGRLILNARVSCEPDELGDILDRALAGMAADLGGSVTSRHRQLFAPARPVPTHHL